MSCAPAYTQEDSKYKPHVPARWGESRSPCPALNALANHNYIPHDGHHISAWQLASSIHLIYRCSWPLAWLLTLVGTIWCGRGLWLNLHDLALHNRIEHDGSLGHDDALPGHLYAPASPSAIQLDNLLSTEPQPGSDLSTYGMEDFALARVRREKSLAVPLNWLHKQIALGESSLTLLTFGDEQGRVKKERILQWMLEERLPADWEGPLQPLTILGAASLSREIEGRMKQV